MFIYSIGSIEPDGNSVVLAVAGVDRADREKVDKLSRAFKGNIAPGLALLGLTSSEVHHLSEVLLASGGAKDVTVVISLGVFVFLAIASVHLTDAQQVLEGVAALHCD